MQAPFRLLIIGKKRLPTAEGHERFFGFVEATAGESCPQPSAFCTLALPTLITNPCKCDVRCTAVNVQIHDDVVDASGNHRCGRYGLAHNSYFADMLLKHEHWYAVAP